MSDVKKTSKKLVECASCGAQFDEMLPKCPYCESMSIKGAQAEYMDKLEDVREDMEELGSVHNDILKKEFKKQTKFIFIIIGVVLGIFLLLVAIELIASNRYPKRDTKADYAWQQENIPKFEELYEQAKYEELVELYVQVTTEGRPIYQWEHSEFCAAMERFFSIEEIWQKEQSGEELDHWDYEDLLYMAFRVDNYETSMAYSQEELVIMEPYIERIREDFETRWNMPEEDLAYFKKIAEKNHGYISHDEIKKYVEKWMERNQKG